MPTYDYVCEKCAHEFEVFQSMKDPRLEDCPREGCGGHVRRKIGTGAGLIFKGSGFYETDYRSESYKQAAKKESDGAKASSKEDTGGASGGSGGGGGGDSKKSGSNGGSASTKETGSTSSGSGAVAKPPSSGNSGT